MHSFFKTSGKKMLLAICIAAVAIFFSLFYYQKSVSKAIQRDMRDQVDALLSTSLHEVESELHYLTGLNQNSALFMTSLALDDPSGMLATLNSSLRDDCMLTSFCLTAEGNIYTNYGETLSAMPEGMPRDYSAYFASQGSAVLSPWYSPEQDDLLFGIVSPVRLADTDGLLITTYPVSLFYDIFANDFLDGSSEIGILKNDCTVILGKNKPDRLYQFGLDIVDSMEQINTTFTISSSAEMRQTIADGKTGFSAYYVDDTERYCSFSPIEGTDWYLIVMAKEIILRDQSEEFTLHGLVLTIMLISIMTLLLLTILVLHYRAQKQVQLALEKAASIDSLTGIWNRGTIEKRILSYLEEQGKHTPFALVILDIDNFKNINDSYGHMAGDRVLQMLSSLLEKSFLPDHLIGRMGGDEFIILLKNCPDKETAIREIQPLLAPMTCAVPSLPQPIPVSVSMGICLDHCTGKSFLELYQHADKALYETKGQGKNSYSFYIP